LKRFLALSLALSGTLVPTAYAAQVRGTILAPAAAAETRTVGYTKTRVAGAGRPRRTDVGVFLEVTDSLPLPPPSAKWPLKVHGMRFEPSVVSCVVDEEVVITNDDRGPVTITVGEEAVGEVPPGKSKSFKCQRGGSNSVRVGEWPHMRAVIFVGEVGMAARPDGEGRFQFNVPEGTYQVKVIGSDGVLATKSVSVAKTDVDLGMIEVSDKGSGSDSKEEEPPAKSPVKLGKAPPPKPAAVPAKAEQKPKPKAKKDDDEIKLEP
jgi:hypothetical protein